MNNQIESNTLATLTNGFNAPTVTKAGTSNFSLESRPAFCKRMKLEKGLSNRQAKAEYNKLINSEGANMGKSLEALSKAGKIGFDKMSINKNGNRFTIAYVTDAHSKMNVGAEPKKRKSKAVDNMNMKSWSFILKSL